MSVKKSRYRRKNAEGLYDTYHFETEVDQVNGLDDYMLEKMEKIAAHNADDTAHANGISGNAATATRLKPTLNGSRNQCWLLCKLPKAATALVHYKILGAQYYDQYSTLEVAIKNGFGWCKYVGRDTNWLVSVKAYDTGTSIDVYLFAPGYCDFWELFLQKNGAAEFTYRKMGDATYVPTGTLVCDTGSGLGMDGVELFNGENMRELIKKAGGMPLGSIMPFLSKAAPAGWLACDTGAIVSRATYPELWTWVQANAPLISEAEWQAQAAEQSSVGAYSTGDGSTTFRLPRIVDYVRGGLTADVGEWQGDAIRNITGSYFSSKGTESISLIKGAFKKTSATLQGGAGHVGDAFYSQATIKFDAGDVVPTADENRPKTIQMLYCVKAFNAETNQGLIDITALANEMTSKVDKTDVGFTVIYPNDGANITTNTRYVMDNPFMGYEVECRAEILNNGEWCVSPWLPSSTAGNYYGVNVSHLMPSDKIIVRTAKTALSTNDAGQTGAGFTTPGQITSAQCRILVWKIGRKIN